MIGALWQDIGFALRQFRKRPAFTVTAVLILALGLGANTAIFSLVDVFLLRPLPYPEPDRLAALFERDVAGFHDPYNWVAPGNFYDWQKMSASFESMGAYFTGPVNVASPGGGIETQRVDGCGCSADLFTTLRVAPLLGRTFRAEEDRFGVARVAVISYDLWQARYGGARDIIGKRIRLDGENCEVIGVMPRGFAFPDRTIQVWLPIQTYTPPARQLRHDIHYMRAIGRLRPGVTVEQARAEIDGIASRYKKAHPNEFSGEGANVVPLQDSLVHNVRTSLLVFLGAVGCVLLIACVNVANLLLVRASGRARELAIRAAVGAARTRIIGQLLIESVLLAVAGGIAGLLLASLIADILVVHAPGAESILPPGNIPFDPRAFAFTFVIALLAGIAAGLYPALQSSRADLANGLKDSSRSATPSRSHGRFRTVLVAAEVALSLMLLVSAGLLLRSFARLTAVPPGVRVEHTLTLGTSLDHRYETAAQRAAFHVRLAQQLDRLPGVLAAGQTSCAPVSGHCDDSVFYVEGRPAIANQIMDAARRNVDPGYFRAAGIPLLRGRTFTAQDSRGFDEKHPRLTAAVISEAMAKTFFPGEDPIGKRIVFDADTRYAAGQHLEYPRYQIVGIVGDVPENLDRKILPTAYTPLLSGDGFDFAILLHTAGDPRDVISGARAAVHSLDPELAVYEVLTMKEVLGRSAAGRRFSTLLFGAFAGLAVLLAAVGLYGVLSYSVSQRRGEIGIRIALGAAESDVRNLVLRQGMQPAIAGTVIGLACAFLATRILKSLLFDIAPSDPLTFMLVPLLLLGIAALACYLPATRAARTDPTITLQAE